jgi:hypothetical protein
LVTVLLDGQPQSFEQSAVFKDGSTLVPLRGIFEKLGAKVDWDNDTRTVTATKGDIAIKLKVGANFAYVNGRSVTLAAKAEIINGSTMVPLRFVSEALGAEVKWDNDTTTAIITSAGGSVTAPTQQTDAGQTVNGISVCQQQLNFPHYQHLNIPHLRVYIHPPRGGDFKKIIL